MEYFGKLGLSTPAHFQQASFQSSSGRPPAPFHITQLAASAKVAGNAGATLWDTGDGVALLEFHSKANSIGQEVLEMFDVAHAKVLESFQALVIGNHGENFCAGADLNMLLHVAQMGDWEKIRQAVKVFQGMTSRLRFSPYPVVSAPHKMVLGGGLEVALWSDACAANSELYTGLVEVGVGILPAGGGTTEMLLRFSERALPDADPFLAVKQAFELIAMAKVSTSAAEAQSMGFLRSTDKIVMNQDRLLEEARLIALSLVPGYRPPQKRHVAVMGEAGLSNLRAGAMAMAESGFITEYEVHIATTVGEVLCGGKLNRSDTISEDLLLELEGEAFLHLCGQEKTRQRLEHMLKTGKPLRN
jgi:3-hydroxyacyl-CoA dehydrogenase